MASSAIHLAVAKEYLKNKPGMNRKEFFRGVLYPDAVGEDDKTHYTDLNRGSDNVSHVRGKVNLYQFLKEHQNLSDFELGCFLHLVTDYLFFLECFTEEYLLSKSYQEFCNELYHAYTCTNAYIEEKYDLKMEDYESYPSEYYSGIPYEECILSKKLVDEFIKRVSCIDFDLYIKKIRKNKRNIKP